MLMIFLAAVMCLITLLTLLYVMSLADTMTLRIDVPGVHDAPKPYNLIIFPYSGSGSGTIIQDRTCFWILADPNPLRGFHYLIVPLFPGLFWLNSVNFNASGRVPFPSFFFVEPLFPSSFLVMSQHLKVLRPDFYLLMLLQGRPASQASHFMKIARAIGTDITRTFSKLEKLTLLAK